MRRLLLVLGLVALVSGDTAAAVLQPGRTVVSPSTISALGVTHKSVVFAVGEAGDRRRCAYVVLWNTATKGLWRLGADTTRVCTEAPSTGSGISRVATSGRRVFWVTYVGGNVREETLWTATPTRRSPRRLADAASDADADERPLVLGPGTRDGVPYATGGTVTYVADSGARLFRVTLPSPVRRLAAGIGPGRARVVAALADGSVIVLAGNGAVLRTDEYEPGAVSAVGLALPGAIVQVGSTIRLGPRASVTLPSKARLLDFRQGRIVYAQGAQVRARRVATGADVLLRVLPVKSWETPLFATDAWGSAWADGRAIGWRSGPLT